MKIPFNKSEFIGNELNYIKDVINRGHTSGDGFYSKACNKLFEKDFAKYNFVEGDGNILSLI